MPDDVERAAEQVLTQIEELQSARESGHAHLPEVISEAESLVQRARRLRESLQRGEPDPPGN